VNRMKSADKSSRRRKRSKGSKSPAAPRLDSLSFAARLAATAAGPLQRKGQRTRARLKAAAAQLLESGGYRDLRVTDINERANVSNALFYIYFPNKEKITHEVMTEFLDMLFASPASDTAPSGVEETIYRANLAYVRLFAANPGLMRCLLQFGDEIPEFEKLWRERNAQWLERGVKRMSREPELAGKSSAEIWSSIGAMGMMLDGVLRLLYVERWARARENIMSIAADEPRLALFFTRLWVRALFGREMTWSPTKGR
jgi:TetR/AcrR family transcriptional regulator, transcriptional repressor for nem operon